MVEVDLLAALVAGLPATVVMTVMMSATKAAWPTHGALPAPDGLCASSRSTLARVPS